MRILLTAYGPFRDVKENIAELVLDEINNSWDHATDELITLKLPVEWAGAETLLLRALTELAPDVVVSTGHAEKYPTITMETRYFNIAEGEDNRGETRTGGVVNVGTKEFYDTTIDAKELVHHLSKKNIPVVLHGGKDGMSYLCNFTGYVVMHHIRNHQREKPLFIFLHLPPNAMPFPVLVRGVRETINFLVLKA